MEASETPSIAPGGRLVGRVVATFAARTIEREFGFVTKATDDLTLTFEGIPGDRHSGWTRRSGGREPWYPRGTEMRNERQLSLLAPDDLIRIAEGLGVPEVKAEWIGGNILVEGLPHFSMIPSRSRLNFEGGAVVVIDGQNSPCRLSGRSIAQHYPEEPDIELAFPRVAKRLRGLVGWVEKPGVIRPGTPVYARIPEQWVYPLPPR